MKLAEVEELFELLNDEFIKFERIPENERPFSSPDLCAFAYLDKRFPSDNNMDMVSAAEHDEIWLRIEWEQIEQLTRDDVIYLTRCGVRYDDDSLALFV